MGDDATRPAWVAEAFKRAAFAERESESRRRMLEVISEERRREWQRAEAAEAELVVLQLENERLRHGNTLEGDFVCPNDLACVNAEEHVARLRAALSDALDTAEEGWSYADDYFKTKWGAAASLQRIRATLVASEAEATTGRGLQQVTDHVREDVHKSHRRANPQARRGRGSAAPS